MNIKEHYSFMARLYFHQSILFTVVFTVIILPNVKKADFLLSNLAGLAVFLCMIYFILRCLYFSYKISAVSMMLSNGPMAEHNETLLIIPSHNANCLMEAYSSDGIRRLSLLIVKGKERRARLKYYELGKRGRLFKINEHGIGTTAYMHIDQSGISFITSKKKLSVMINTRGSKSRSFIVGPDHFELKKPYSDRMLLKNGRPVMTIKKGLMPIKWQQYFSPNTPLLKVDSSLSKEERSLCLCLLVLF
ncbi:hypothetical protein QNH23_06645 [Siminovitchia fortis]|uniref:Uncharacterized protein n=1 Tax=Siminovitchia fortis TaxID=254758 RepID=A0A443IJ59_9BACI|nr:hypothetical protein [Siminovitchia fortis]RWR04451.1 hypothetical protein D4N35_016915 [Siminovitchia fortis]WHY83050.1 hypothetical protein QNH23_06645 [Siminovitchia fortis]